MAFNPYAAGNKIYRGGSSAATMGTVDPMGYIERESNKRSGLASAAMRRIQGFPVGTTPEAQLPQVQKPQPGAANQAPGGFAIPTGPSVYASMTGQVLPVPQNVAMPYDAQFADESQGLLEDYQNTGQNITRNRQVLERNYAVSRRDQEEQLPEQLRGLLNNYAGRGLAFSSGYGQGVGEVQRGNARQLSDLDFTRTQGLDELAQNEGYAQSAYQRQLNALMAAATRRLSERAGTLGYDKTNPLQVAATAKSSVRPVNTKITAKPTATTKAAQAAAKKRVAKR